LPVAFIFGYMNDFALWVVGDLTYNNYFEQWIYCLIGIVLVAIGVSMEVVGDVVTLAGEGAVIAISKVTGIKFTTMKVVFDVALVVIAVVMSFVLLGGLYGVREGTLAAAILVGIVAKPFIKLEEKINFSGTDKSISSNEAAQ